MSLRFEGFGAVFFCDAERIKELSELKAMTLKANKRVVPSAKAKTLGRRCPSNVDTAVRVFVGEINSLGHGSTL
jgi:hypothetical protein